MIGAGRRFGCDALHRRVDRCRLGCVTAANPAADHAGIPIMDHSDVETLPAPVELDAADLLAVAGGLNPQPLPPYREE